MARLRLNAKERQRASAQSSYLAVPGPAVAHPRQNIPRHVATRPDILLYNGRTMVQPRLPPLYSNPIFTGEYDNGDTEAPSYDERDILPSDGNVPVTPRRDPTAHRRKREAQWRRWQGEVLPNLLPHYVRFLEQTKSLRDFDQISPSPRTTPCVCLSTKSVKIAIVHFSCMSRVRSHCIDLTPLSRRRY